MAKETVQVLAEHASANLQWLTDRIKDPELRDYAMRARGWVDAIVMIAPEKRGRSRALSPEKGAA